MGTFSLLNNLSFSRKYSALRIRAIRVGVLKRVYPNWQAIILISSDAVTAIIKSASAAPASRKTLGDEGEPLTTRKSCLSCKFCKC